jgi:hypothetical protein
MPKMRLLLAMVAGLILASPALAQCPGNFLQADHRPRGASETWTMTLNDQTGQSRLVRREVVVTGQVDMSCGEGRWTAQLTGQSHGIAYNCIGYVHGASLRAATCQTSVGGIIEIENAQFSTVQ